MNNFEYAEDIPGPGYEAWDQRRQETNDREELVKYRAWWPKYQASLEALDRQKTLTALASTDCCKIKSENTRNNPLRSLDPPPHQTSL